MNGYLHALKQYAVFKGRTRRRDYWYFALFQIIAVLAISFVERQLAIANPEILFGWFTALYLLVTLLPALAVTVRRLHDTSRSGWWVLLYIIPLIGAVVVLTFTLLDSTPGNNKYGANPKG